MTWDSMKSISYLFLSHTYKDPGKKRQALSSLADKNTKAHKWHQWRHSWWAPRRKAPRAAPNKTPPIELAPFFQMPHFRVSKRVATEGQNRPRVPASFWKNVSWHCICQDDQFNLRPLGASWPNFLFFSHNNHTPIRWFHQPIWKHIISSNWLLSLKNSGWKWKIIKKYEQKPPSMAKTPYIGDGNPTFNGKYLYLVYKPLLQGWWPCLPWVFRSLAQFMW